MAFGLEFELLIDIRTFGLRTGAHADGDVALEVGAIGMRQPEHGVEGGLGRAGGPVVAEVRDETLDGAAPIKIGRAHV